MKYIDLFAGAGGLSEGFLRERFEPVAHVEMNIDACYTIKTRMAYDFLCKVGKLDIYKDYLKGKITREQLYNEVPNDIIDSVINKIISKDTIDAIFEKIDYLLEGNKVDLIIGGPPCQAYSVIGRARKKNEGGMEGDDRNYLFERYADFLEKYEPKCFVFENVPGLVSAGKGKYLQEMYAKFKELGYEVNINLEGSHNRKKVQIFDTSKFGVLQKRERVIIFGYKQELDIDFDVKEVALPEGSVVLKDLLDDLPKLKQGESKPIIEYTKNITDYQNMVKLRDEDFDFTTQHIARMQNERDLNIYKRAIELWLNERKRLNYADLPEDWKTHKNQKTFLNRFQVVDPNGFSHTMVAHISCDGHYYIYPDLNNPRSVSVREAARIQSFPDNYFFEGSRTSIFKQIGNAVPPMFAQQIAKAIKFTLLSLQDRERFAEPELLEYATV